jgi:pimeloyl-ACP methyl ester carboxylesterase
VITWSQQRPAAEIAVAASELREVLDIHRTHCRSGIILIGHSRGGLVARNYLRYETKDIRGIVTLATPHRGSKMALWVKHMAPLITLAEPLISDSEKGTFTYALKRVLDFLKSTAVRELLPDSLFFRTCDEGPLNGVYYLSFGGSNPALFSVYRRIIEKTHVGDQERWRVRAQRVFSVPDAFERFIPERLFPDEMKKGRGDGLVSVESSRIPWADEHHTFDVNHAGILFSEKVRHKVLDAVRRFG